MYIYIYPVYDLNIYFSVKNKILYAAVDIVMTVTCNATNHDEFKLGVDA